MFYWLLEKIEKIKAVDKYTKEFKPLDRVYIKQCGVVRSVEINNKEVVYWVRLDCGSLISASAHDLTKEGE